MINCLLLSQNDCVADVAAKCDYSAIYSCARHTYGDPPTSGDAEFEKYCKLVSGAYFCLGTRHMTRHCRLTLATLATSVMTWLVDRQCRSTK